MHRDHLAFAAEEAAEFYLIFIPVGQSWYPNLNPNKALPLPTPISIIY
ncbi:MAG: hypothetical protein FJ042_05085 [Candidatus Cloacimonetes bacterium]|nr:hypothetical protein [Candidatus Cloacimonadota bacterium]